VKSRRSGTERRRPPAIPFCGAEAWQPDARFDVTVVGVPSDLGMYGSGPSAAGAPAVLRSASRLFPIVREGGEAGIGWYDYTTGRSILEARRIADAGDFVLDRHRPLQTLEHLPEELRRLRENTRLLVVLGGDHSLSYWTTRGLDEGSVLLFLDAHEDATEALAELPHCGNVISFLERESHLAGILQYGLRGLVPNRRNAPSRTRHVCRGLKEWQRRIRQLRRHRMGLSIDVDVLEPALMGSVASPSPGGMTPAELARTVESAVEMGAHIDMLEVMEFAPGSGREVHLNAMALVQIILRLADICLRER